MLQLNPLVQHKKTPSSTPRAIIARTGIIDTDANVQHIRSRLYLLVFLLVSKNRTAEKAI